MLRVGLLGCGRQGWRRSRALQANGDSLVVAADTNMALASALAKAMGCEAEPNWEQVVKRYDLDAIIVCTPNHLHATMSMAAMNNGCHILCEKPLATTIDDAEEIVKVSRQTGLKVKCGFTLRHHPGIQQVRKWVDQGLLGELNFLRIRYGIGGREGYDKEWRALRRLAGGGQLMDQGVHALDLSRWFLGEFSEVHGYLAKYFWKNADVEDNAFCLLRTEHGQVASIHVSWTQWKNLFSLEVYGQDGYAQVEGLGGSYGTEKATVAKRDFSKPFTEETSEFRAINEEPWLEEWREFKSAIECNREPLGDAYDGLQAVRLCYAVYDSSASERTKDGS
jgi:predicted dehydrogenase